MKPVKITYRGKKGIDFNSSNAGRRKIAEAIANNPVNDNLLNEPVTYFRRHRGYNNVRSFGRYK